MSQTAIVKLRETGSFKNVTIIENKSLNFEDHIVEKWQNLLEIITRLYEVPTALIMRIHEKEIEVFETSRGEENPYHKKEKAELQLGLYCETVIGTDKELEVVDSLKSSIWENNPDVELNMISYLGYPIKWPDGSFFGTICVLDSQPRQFTKIYKELLMECRGTLEKDLKLIIRNKELKDSLDLIQKNQKLLIELERDKLTTKLVSSIAHELNTPLGISITTSTFIETRLKSLLKDFGKKADITESGSELIEAMTLLNRNLENAKELISTYQKIASDQSRGEKVFFSVSEYLQTILLNMKYEMKNKNAAFSICADEDIKIESYPGFFSQVILNLISNSLKHGFKENDGNEIKIIIEKNNEKCRITYRDNGSGIPGDYAEKIFDPYFSIDNKSENCGMGLSITREIVDNYLKGNILCEVHTEKGAKFTIEIPIRYPNGQ